MAGDVSLNHANQSYCIQDSDHRLAGNAGRSSELDSGVSSRPLTTSATPQKSLHQLCLVTQTCHGPATQEAEAEGCRAWWSSQSEVEAGLGHLVRPWLKSNKKARVRSSVQNACGRAQAPGEGHAEGTLITLRVHLSARLRPGLSPQTGATKGSFGFPFSSSSAG